MLIRLAHNITRDSIVDGPGLRSVIWTQGCKHNCKGCHNPGTHSFDGGFLMEVEDIIENLKTLRLQRGITLSGGDPFEQPEQCYEIAKAARRLGLDVWCYTGYVYEEIIKSDRKFVKDFLQQIDVLIDGPFILRDKNLLLKFRGSKNQRIIDVKKSIESNSVVIIESYNSQ